MPFYCPFSANAKPSELEFYSPYPASHFMPDLLTGVRAADEPDISGSRRLQPAWKAQTEVCGYKIENKKATESVFRGLLGVLSAFRIKKS